MCVPPMPGLGAVVKALARATHLALAAGVPAGTRPGQPPLRRMLRHGFGLGTCCKLVQFHFSMSVMCLSWLLGWRVASPTAQA